MAVVIELRRLRRREGNDNFVKTRERSSGVCAVCLRAAVAAANGNLLVNCLTPF